ncbi:hypothetical protein K474DRAFT_1660854 [Panus rudis PR-1116 ss-1]|nr:hypothetical protein K474DRAFT_1660854 [Panus rudis PR-1116 ss-1]
MGFICCLLSHPLHCLLAHDFAPFAISIPSLPSHSAIPRMHSPWRFHAFRDSVSPIPFPSRNAKAGVQIYLSLLASASGYVLVSRDG